MSRPTARPERAAPTLTHRAPREGAEPLYPDATLRHHEADERLAWAALRRAADRLTGPAGGELARRAAAAEYAAALDTWRQARAQLDRLLPG